MAETRDILMRPQPVYHAEHPHWRWKRKGCKVGPFGISPGDKVSWWGSYMPGGMYRGWLLDGVTVEQVERGWVWRLELSKDEPREVRNG